MNDIIAPRPQPPRPPANPVGPEDEPEPAIGSGQKKKDQKTSAWREILSTAGILATALLTALFIIAFVFRSYQVDGPSMQNTLQNTDKLIIWKVPRTWSKITHHDYIPSRGDVVVFTQTGLSEFGQQDSKQLIKRVIGLPGERVVVHDGSITIYNEQHPNGFKPDETLPYGKNMPYTSGEVDKTLGRHELFVCGDNRPNSLDSRMFGPISADQIVGKLVLRVFPIGQAKAF
jgi:signal peptidase I